MLVFGFMGHYLSDLLPDPNVVCLNCHEGVWEESVVRAWSGYLSSCSCKKPDHCPVKDIVVKKGRWLRKKKKKK
jgi:hypothetical protein